MSSDVDVKGDDVNLNQQQVRLLCEKLHGVFDTIQTGKHLHVSIAIDRTQMIRRGANADAIQVVSKFYDRYRHKSIGLACDVNMADAWREIC